MKTQIKRLALVFFAIFISTLTFSQTTLNFANSYSISDDVSEPSGLAYDKVNDQLFSVSDTGNIYRLSTTGNLLDSYSFSGDLEGISMYNTSNTLLVAIEDTYQIIEYNYVTGSSTSHTMDYDNQEDSGSGIEGVTYNSNTGEIYFLNEKDPGALIVANSNFNVTDEYELNYADDYSASFYVSETDVLWLGSDDESTIYKCNTDGSIIESFDMRLDGDELDKIEGLAIDYSNQLLYIVTDGGGELLVYEIETETVDNNLSISSINDFDADGGSQTVNITSNVNWNVSESSSWISINNTSDSNDGSFSITTSENTSDNERSATVTISGGDISRSITVLQEGADEEEEIPNTDNLALNGAASQSTAAHGGLASLAIDGNTNGSYSAGSVTHTSTTSGSWWQVELDSQTNIGNIIIYNRTDSCCIDRLSNFTISILDSNNNEVFSQTITEAPTPSVTVSASGVLGNTIRITNNLTNTPLSLAEVEVYAGESNTTSCSEGTNLSLNGTIVDFSTEQNTTNTVQNIIDDSTENRWSAQTFPQYATIDLGDEYNVNEINLATFNNRDYQFTVEGSTNSATSGFSILVDATNNTDEGTINRIFSTQTIRYVRLTITGANNYTGEWASINQFQIICAGSSSNKNINEITSSIDVSTFPNPFINTINLINSSEQATTLRLVNLQGITVTETPISSNETELNNLDYLASGIYLLQVLNTNNQIITIKKIVK